MSKKVKQKVELAGDGAKKFLKLIAEKVNDKDSRFMFTFHYLEEEEGEKDVKIRHNFVTKDFPVDDILACADYMERQFPIEKRKSMIAAGKM